MKCVVGLGNPGKRYAMTRHNVGFMVVDALAASLKLTFKTQRKWRAEVAVGQGFILVKPLTYMNVSGEAIQQIQQFYNLIDDNVLVIHDDLALPPLTLRFRPGGGAGGHNGLKSIIQHLGHQQFKRGRIGIGAAPPLMATSDYVLQPFPKDERADLKDVIERTQAAIKAWLDGMSFENMMTRYNETRATPLP